MTSFMLNTEAEPRSLDGWPAHTTVLAYLRANGLVGTKEGCATGDCGACTAVTVTLVDDRLEFTALNSCIALLPMLAGRLLITVEGLAGPGGKLHPVQQAMADQHGSQCGFCTPGFVMSLFAHVKAGGAATREAVVERLAGNLCRCTGYVPIIAAGQALGKAAANDQYARAAKEIKARLRQLAHGTAPSALQPGTASRLAVELGKSNKVRVVAGGTDLGLEVTQQLAQPELAFAGDVRQLQEFKETKACWRIGAGVTWARLERELAPHLPGFATLMERFGSPQIRQRGTVGGNIGNASPIADGPPVFLALGCRLTLRQGAKRRQVPLDDFYTGYRQTVLQEGEFIESLDVARPPAGADFNVHKVSKREDDDIATVCGAFLVRRDRHGRVDLARVAYGGMAATPARARQCEAALSGAPWDAETIERAGVALARDFTPLSDVRASARYRTLVAANLLRRFHLATGGQSAALERVAV